MAKSKTHTLVMAAMMAALLAVVAPFTIPIGPVPFSLAFFVVFFVGAMLPPLAGMASLAVYVLLGAVGLPVFSGMRAGPQVLVGPTGGYIVGYFVIVLATALAVKHSSKFWVWLLGALGGMAGCYLLGTLWYMAVTGVGFAQALALCVLPFAVADIIKAVLALGLARAVRTRLAKRRTTG